MSVHIKTHEWECDTTWYQTTSSKKEVLEAAEHGPLTYSSVGGVETPVFAGQTISCSDGEIQILEKTQLLAMAV